MSRIYGVLSLLAILFFTLLLVNPDNAAKWSNIKNVLNQQAFFGVLTIGVGILIISGGIDLSIGSVVGFTGVTFCVLMEKGVAPPIAMITVIGMGAIIGLTHGLLVTRLKLQPFLVTLCGLFIYRGLARIVSSGQTTGLQQTIKLNPDATESLSLIRQWLVGKDINSVFGFPMQVVVLLVIAVVVGIILHRTVYGRFWYAIGYNEQAAKYAGIHTNQQKIIVYVLCSTLAALGGVLAMLDYGTATPETFGGDWELYAITGAVLGGCSLRGGEGTIPGMVLGAAVLPLLRNLVSFIGSKPWVLSNIGNIDPVIPVVIGLTLLLGTIADEFFRRRGRAIR